jgi:hypothetical protein
MQAMQAEAGAQGMQGTEAPQSNVTPQIGTNG